MKIAVFSDSHDHIWNTRRASEQANELGAELLVHCGDLVSPFVLEELDVFQGPVHLVLGNNAGDQLLLTKRIARRGGRVELHGWVGRLTLGALRLGFIHDPALAYLMAKSGEFDLVCFGHTHRWHEEQLGSTRLLNPGEILGKKEPAGWALVDTDTLEIRQIRISREG